MFREKAKTKHKEQLPPPIPPKKPNTNKKLKEKTTKPQQKTKQNKTPLQKKKKKLIFCQKFIIYWILIKIFDMHLINNQTISRNFFTNSKKTPP